MRKAKEIPKAIKVTVEIPVCGMPVSMAREIVHERQRRMDMPDETRRALAEIIFKAEGRKLAG